MSKKTYTLLLIFAIYCVGAVLASWLFLVLPFDIIPALLVADIGYTVYIYIWSLILKNASLYDPYWSVIPPVLLILVAIYVGQPLSMGVIFMLFAISFWAIRLTYNWIKHWTGFDYLDWRYQDFKDANPKLYWLTNLFGIQLTPTLVVFTQLVLGTYVVIQNPPLNALTVIGTLLIITAAVIQFIADAQMDAFKKANKGSKKCIDEGLWRLSRHPNYFGEISVWWGLYLIYFSIEGFNPWIISPILMTALFWFISIPMMEKKILKTRPEYEVYQATVSKLIFFSRKKGEQQVREID